MALFPAPVLAAPIARGKRYGLLTAANGPIDLPDRGQASGIVYEPVTCGVTRSYPMQCPAGTDPPDKVFDPADDIVEADAFLVYATYQCGPVGNSPAAIEEKVRRRLENAEQVGAEAGFAAVLAAAADPISAGEPESIRSVVGELEQWLYGADGAGYGYGGFLHAPIRVAAYAANAGMLNKNGVFLQTALGTTWVFGGGYPDDGAIYITGQVTVWRSPDVIIPPAGQTFDRRLNQYNALAERTYAVAYDCAAAVAEYTPPGFGS